MAAMISNSEPATASESLIFSIPLERVEPVETIEPELLDELDEPAELDELDALATLDDGASVLELLGSEPLIDPELDPELDPEPELDASALLSSL
jgi:hypothetical protein